MRIDQLEELMVDLQRLWAQHRDLIDAVTSAGRPDRGSTSKMLDAWWQGVRGSVEPDLERLFEPLVQHARVLFRLTDQLVRSQPGESIGPAEFSTLLQEQLRILSESLDVLSSSTSPIGTPLSHLLDLWNQGAEDITGLSQERLARWLASMSTDSQDHASKIESLLTLPRPTLTGAQHHGVKDFLTALADYQSNIFSIPGLSSKGHGRRRRAYAGKTG